MKTMKMWTKIVIASVEAIIIALLIVFGATSTQRGKTIRNQKASIERMCRQNDSLVNIVNRLGAEDCITVNVAFNLNQKNILSFSANNCQQIAREVATMTRSELYDSIYTKKTEK